MSTDIASVALGVRAAFRLERADHWLERPACFIRSTRQRGGQASLKRGPRRMHLVMRSSWIPGDNATDRCRILKTGYVPRSMLGPISSSRCQKTRDRGEARRALSRSRKAYSRMNGCRMTRAHGALSRGTPRARRSPVWWSQTGSNRRPPACKAGALPAELWPRDREPSNRRLASQRENITGGPGARMHWWAWEDLNFRPHAYQARALTN